MDIVIEKGINPPIHSEIINSLALKIYKEFEINDSSFISNLEIGSGILMNQLRKLCIQNERQDIKFKTQKAIKDNIWGYRIWRIS